jgi:hypothetical protein
MGRSCPVPLLSIPSFLQKTNTMNNDATAFPQMSINTAALPNALKPPCTTREERVHYAYGKIDMGHC